MTMRIYPEATTSSEINRYKYTATAGQTSISGADDNGITLSYTSGKEQLYLNGVLLSRSLDYSATNGTTITSMAALSLNDIIEVLTFSPSIISSGWSLLSSTNLSGNLSTSIDLPSGYSQFKFIQVVSGTNNIAYPSFSYRLNNNSGNVYADMQNGVLVNSIVTTSYVYQDSSPLIIEFDINMPDFSIPHSVSIKGITLGSGACDSRIVSSGMSTSSAITSIQVIATDTAFTGTIYVYGVK